MVKIGIIQMLPTEDKSANVLKAEYYVKKCAEGGADIVVLPEIFNGPYSTLKFREYSEEKGGETWKRLSKMAKDNSVVLIGGSIPEICDERIYNTSFIFDEGGNQIGQHRKMHLFDIDIEGGQSFKESDALTAGNDVTVVETRFTKIGICICFDLRFPELARLMVLNGAKIIVVPAAFNMTTGPAHWETMFRQRAVDNQCYTVGVAPSRNEKGSYVSYGNSICVDPWGNTVFRAGHEETFQVVDIDLGRVEAIRNQLPLLSARRKDIYSISLNAKADGFMVAEPGDSFEVYYVLNEARNLLFKKNIQQWTEGWDINNLKALCLNSSIHVLREKGSIIGLFCLQDDPPVGWMATKHDSAYLSFLCLLPQYQGRGIGRNLLRYAFDQTKKNIYLDVWNGNLKLKSFYASAGFEYVEDIPEKDYIISVFVHKH